MSTSMRPVRHWRVTLGNVEPRPGHRHDCAQVELTIQVAAADKGTALDAVRLLAKRGALTSWLPFLDANLGLGHPTIMMTIAINPAHLGSRSVRVEEIKP